MKLSDQVEAATGADRELDALIALALGWRERRVGRLGLSGRTPGSFLWFPPDETLGMKGRVRPPAFTGPRKRKDTAAALRARGL